VIPDRDRTSIPTLHPEDQLEWPDPFDPDTIGRGGCWNDCQVPSGWNSAGIYSQSICFPKIIKMRNFNSYVSSLINWVFIFRQHFLLDLFQGFLLYIEHCLSLRNKKNYLLPINWLFYWIDHFRQDHRIRQFRWFAYNCYSLS